MSKYPPSQKIESDKLLRIDTRILKREACLEEKTLKSTNLLHYFTGNWKVLDVRESKYFLIKGKLEYLGNKINSYLDVKVPLTSLQCNFGGQRYWFECLNCNRRIGKLYYLNGKLACRHCHNLTYISKQIGKSKIYKIYRWKKTRCKIERLKEQIKRRQYAKKETKKSLKLDRLYYSYAKYEKNCLCDYYRRKNKEEKLIGKGKKIKRPVDFF